MSIPDTVKVGGHIYGVSYNPICSNDDGTVCLGRHCGSQEIIELHPGYPQGTQEAALIHEIVEALNWQNELGMEHRMISSLSEGLYQVLKENDLRIGKE